MTFIYNKKKVYDMKWVSIPNWSIRLVEIEGPDVKAVDLQQAQTNMHHEGRQRADQPISL